MSNLLKLHVLMPTFNRADLLDQTLRQVLNQDCDESLWKLTVIDNASTDKTKEILKKYSNLNNNFEFIINPRNVGLFGNLNNCIDFAETQKFMIIHSDDSVVENFIPKALETIKNLEDTDLIIGPSKAYLLESNESLENWHSSELFTQGINKIDNFQFFNSLIKGSSNFIFAPSVIYDKNFFGADLRYSENYSFTSDFDLWLKVSLKKCTIGIYTEPLVICNIHPKRLSHLYAKTMRLEYVSICKKYLNLLNKSSNNYILSNGEVLKIRIRLIVYKLIIKFNLVPGFKIRRLILKIMDNFL